MPAAEKYNRANTYRQYSDPPSFVETVTPSDSTDLTYYTQSIYVGVTGDVRLTPIDVADGSYVLYKALAAGRYNIRAKRIWSTGTTATNILAES